MIKHNNNSLENLFNEGKGLMSEAARLNAGLAAVALIRSVFLQMIPRKMGLFARLTGRASVIEKFLNSKWGSLLIAAAAHCILTIAMPNREKVHTVTRLAVYACMAELSFSVPYQKVANKLADSLEEFLPEGEKSEKKSDK